MRSSLLFFLTIVIFLTTGCGKGKSGVILKVTTDTPGIAPLSKLRLATAGDSAADFPDRNLTPHSFTIAFKSFKLFKTGANIPSYTVFDVDFSSPIIVSLKTGEALEVKENNADPARGTYNRIEYQIRYFEMTIPLCDAGNSCEDHRLRFYLSGDRDPDLNFIPTPGDLLLSRSVNGTDFSWISPAQGIPASFSLFPITAPRPVNPTPVQIPVNLFPIGGGVTPLFTQTLTTPLEVPREPDKEFVFTLHFDLADLFFFDNTDEDDIDPGPEFRFNALITDPNVSRDGKIALDCADPTCRADFWPGLPPVTVTISEEDRRD